MNIVNLIDVVMRFYCHLGNATMAVAFVNYVIRRMMLAIFNDDIRYLKKKLKKKLFSGFKYTHRERERERERDLPSKRR